MAILIPHHLLLHHANKERDWKVFIENKEEIQEECFVTPTAFLLHGCFNIHNKFVVHEVFLGNQSISKRIEINLILSDLPSPFLKATRLSSGNSTPNNFLNSLKLLYIDDTFTPFAMITRVSDWFDLFTTELLIFRAVNGRKRVWKAMKSWKATISKETWILFRFDVMWTSLVL